MADILVIAAMSLHAYRRTVEVRALESTDLRPQRVRPAVGTVPPSCVDGELFPTSESLA